MYAKYSGKSSQFYFGGRFFSVARGKQFSPASLTFLTEVPDLSSSLSCVLALSLIYQYMSHLSLSWGEEQGEEEEGRGARGRAG